MSVSTNTAGGKWARWVLSRSPVLTRLLIAILSFLLVALLYLGAALNLTFSSDDVFVLLMAQSVLHGNALLHGWTIATHSFLTTELPLQVLATLLLGFSPRTLYIVAAVQWALVAWVFIYLCAADARGRVSAVRLFVGLCLSGYILALMATQGPSVTSHLVTYVYLLGCVTCVRSLESQEQRKYFVAYALLLTLALVGDSLALVLMVIPVLWVCSVHLLARRSLRTASTLLILTIASVAASQSVLVVVGLAGGPNVPGEQASFVRLEALGQNLWIWAEAFFSIFKVDFFGQNLASLASLEGLFRLLALVTFVAAVHPLARTAKDQPLYVQILLAVVAADNAAFVFSDRPVLYATRRYLVPTVVFGLLLVAHQISQWPRATRRPVLTIAAVGLLGLSLCPSLSLSMRRMPIAALSSFLLKHHLTSGYAPYLTAHTGTLASSGKIALRPVFSPDATVLRPFPWAQERRWFLGPANFVVVDTLDSSPQAITAQQAEDSFGAPSSQYHVGQYLVLAWAQDVVSPEGATLRLTDRAISVHGSALWELPRQVGFLQGAALVSSGKPGTLIFGPYVNLTAGDYRLTVRGSASQVSSAWVDVTTNQGAVELAKFPITAASSASTDVIASGPVKLDMPAHDLEVRVYVGEEDVVRLTGYDLLPAAP